MFSFKTTSFLKVFSHPTDANSVGRYSSFDVDTDMLVVNHTLMLYKYMITRTSLLIIALPMSISLFHMQTRVGGRAHTHAQC